MTYPESRVSGNATVHGFVHVRGSWTVTEYSSVSTPRRGKRSTSFNASLVGLPLPFRPYDPVLPLKFVVSRTSVGPSQWPRESPMYEWIADDKCGRWSSGTMRVS